MDLFSITCTTCKSRLRVREQAAIGQILACPKCGGMVMVKPPPSWSDSRGSKAEMPTATEVIGAAPRASAPLASSAFDAVDDLLSDAPPKVPGSSVINPPAAAPTPAPRRDSPPVPAKPRFMGGPPVPPPLPAKTQTAEAQPTLRSETPVEQPAVSDSAKLAPPPPAETDVASAPAPVAASQRWRFWLVTAGSAAVGIVLAFAAVTVVIQIFRNSLPTPAQNGGGPSVASKPAPSSTVVSPPATSSVPDVPMAAVPPAVTASPEPPAEPKPKEAAASLPSQPVPAVSEPLGIVKDASPPTSATPGSGDPLAKFDALIGGGVEDPLAKASPPTSASSTTAAQPDTTPTKPIAARPPAREIDVAKRLADPLLGIESSATPLADFLQSLSDYSTIPISLELDALPLVKVSAETPVVLKAVNTTVGGALAEGLRPLKLEFVIVDNQLVARLAEPNPMAAIDVSAKDLTDGSEQQLGELAELLRAVVEPSSWGNGGGGEMMANAAKNALTVRHRRSVQAQVLLACDKLRVARGKPTALKLDPAVVKSETRWIKAKARLEAAISLNYSQPTRLVTVLERLSAAGGIRILVDWRDVAAGGWNPAAEATLIADKQPLSAALDALLAPLDLTWRVVDGQTVEVVTPARYSERVELELYKLEGLLPGDPSGEKTVAKIRTALGEDTFRSAGGNGEIRFDVEGQCLLAALPQPKQRELEALLAKWIGDAGKK